MDGHPARGHCRVELPFTGAAPSTARSYLRLFARNLSAATLDEALVMVSELVTNALQHGKPEITLQLWLRPDRIAVAVLDRGDASPSLIHPAPRGDHPHGRGLMLVNALAAHWGVRCSEGRAGKTVWFDLATVD